MHGAVIWIRSVRDILVCYGVWQGRCSTIYMQGAMMVWISSAKSIVVCRWYGNLAREMQLRGIAWLVLQAVAWYAMVWPSVARYGMARECYGMVWHVLQDMAQDMVWQLASGCSSVVVVVWQGMVWYVMATVWQ